MNVFSKSSLASFFLLWSSCAPKGANGPTPQPQTGGGVPQPSQETQGYQQPNPGMDIPHNLSTVPALPKEPTATQSVCLEGCQRDYAPNSSTQLQCQLRCQVMFPDSAPQ